MTVESCTQAICDYALQFGEEGAPMYQPPPLLGQIMALTVLYVPFSLSIPLSLLLTLPDPLPRTLPIRRTVSHLLARPLSI